MVDVTKRKQSEIQREDLIQKRQQALDEVNSLSGIMPLSVLTANKDVMDKGYWDQIEDYIRKH